MAEPERENCSRIYFCYAALILRTNSKFQTPLTLNSHKSGLKNYRIKNYHIFGISRTSAFIWHPRIPPKASISHLLNMTMNKFSLSILIRVDNPGQSWHSPPKMSMIAFIISRACLAVRFTAKNGDNHGAGKIWENWIFTGKTGH